MVHTKSEHLEHHLKSGKLSAWHRKKGQGVPVMVWGCFGGENRGAFCPFVAKSVNAKVYLKLLEYLVPPVVQRINDTIGDAIFQQNNAPVHIVSVVTE